MPSITIEKKSAARHCMWNFIIPRLQRFLKLLEIQGIGRRLCQLLSYCPSAPSHPQQGLSQLHFSLARWLPGTVGNRCYRRRLATWMGNKDSFFPVFFYPYQDHLCHNPSLGCGNWSVSSFWVFYFSGIPNPTSCYPSGVSVLVGLTSSSKFCISASRGCFFKFPDSDFPKPSFCCCRCAGGFL